MPTANLREDACELSLAELGSSSRVRFSSRHFAEKFVATLKASRSAAARRIEAEKSCPTAQGAFTGAEFANEKPLMLKLGLLAVVLILAGLGLSALG